MNSTEGKGNGVSPSNSIPSNKQIFGGITVEIHTVHCICHTVEIVVRPSGLVWGKLDKDDCVFDLMELEESERILKKDAS